jgi:hypothetical protein
MGSLSTSFDYLATCSESALESYELARWGRAANLRKQFLELIEEWVQCEVEARLARMTRDFRRVDTHDPAECSAKAILAAPAQQLALPLVLMNEEVDYPTTKREPQPTTRISAVRNAPSTKILTTVVRRTELRGVPQRVYGAGCLLSPPRLSPPARSPRQHCAGAGEDREFHKSQGTLHQCAGGALHLQSPGCHRSPKSRLLAPRPFRRRQRSRAAGKHQSWTIGRVLGLGCAAAMSA